MPSFKLYTSNKSEILLDALSEVVKAPQESLFTPEFIIVQNKGMERWLSLELSRKLGIWGNCKYFFPNEFIEYLFTLAFPSLPDRSILESRFLAWKIMEILPRMLELKGFESLKDYLSDGRQLKLYQLSSLIADTFDQYSLYRPQMVRDWDLGKDTHWQAVLWRALFNGRNSLHRSQLQAQLLSLISKGTFSHAMDQTRISIFGISSLPIYHREIILSLSSVLDVHLFLLNPCNEFWDDVLSEKEIFRITRARGKKIKAQDDLHWESGNKFLASMGGFGRDFLSDLHSSDGEEFLLFSEPFYDTLLACVQSDILHLCDRGLTNSLMPFPKNDYSIQVHSCHSPLREVEILYDNILGLFEKLPGLSPSDIVVMTPDISLYAPFINAVFGSPEQKQLSIPYSVADRKQDSESPIISDFLSILSLANNRCTSSEIVSLLESTHIRLKFSLSEDDVEQIRIWIAESRIYWGLNEKHRANFVSPSFPDNTWKSGIDQLLLGYALASDDILLFEGIAPFTAIEGNQARILGRFLDFFTCIENLFDSISESRTLEEWGSFLLNTLKCFFLDADDGPNDMEILKKTLKEFAAIHEACGLSGKIDFETVRYVLRSELSASRSSSGFLTGSMTFCEMLPMRSIPFKIVCLLGMNDSVFPRKTRRPSWDLVAANPQKGDRSLEKEDRYIFLEALLCARNVFYVSYIGHDIKDNSPHHPSVAVMELLDFIDRTFSTAEGPIDFDTSKSTFDDTKPSSSSRIIVHHKLQAFSPSYFSFQGPLKSFSKENCAAAFGVLSSPNECKNFFSTSLPDPPKEWSEVTVADLCAFFSNPARYLLKNRLGISMSDFRIDLTEKEPFRLEGLDEYDVGQLLLDKFIQGASRESCRNFLKAKGMLPHGNVGLCAFNRIADEVSELVHAINSLRASQQSISLPIKGIIGNFSISGSVNGYSPPFLYSYRFGHKRSKDLIALWINTLALCALSPEAKNSGGIFACRDGIWEFFNIENAGSLLKGALDLFTIGLSRPLPFFPESSWVYARRILEKKDSSDAALKEAQKTWLGNEYQKGEISDEYCALCYRNDSTDALDDEFCSTSLKFLSPLFNHLREKR